MSPEHIKSATRNIVQRFVDAHHPEERAYLDLIWEQVLGACPTLFDSTVQRRSLEWAHAVPGLAFTGGGSVQLAAPIAIIAVAAALCEMNMQGTFPAKEKIQTAIHRCVRELGVAPRNANQLTQKLTPLLDGYLRDCLAQSADVDTAAAVETQQTISVEATGVIIVDGKSHDLGQSQIGILFCEFVRKRTIHWGHVVCVLKEWRRQIPGNPLAQFRQRISRLRAFLSRVGAKLLIQPAKDSGGPSHAWMLHVPDSVVLTGGLEAARQLCGQARSLATSADAPKRFALAMQACDKDSGFVDAAVLLSESASSNTPPAESAETLRKAHRCLWASEAAHEETVQGLRRMGGTDHHDELTETANRFADEFDSVLERLTKARITLEAVCAAGQMFNPHDHPLLKVQKYLQNIHRARRDRRKRLLLGLYEMPQIQDVSKSAVQNVSKVIQTETETPGMSKAMLAAMLSLPPAEWIRFDSLVKLQAAWITRLTRHMVENLVESEFDVDRKQQRDMRAWKHALQKIRGTQEEGGKEPSDEKVLKRLGSRWTIIRLGNAKRAEKELIGRERHKEFDLAAYWRLYHKAGAAS